MILTMHTSVQSQVKIVLQARTTDWYHERFLLCDFWLVFACIDGGITSECVRKRKRVQISILVEGLQSAIFNTKGTHPMGKCRQSHDSELCHHSVSLTHPPVPRRTILDTNCPYDCVTTFWSLLLEERYTYVTQKLHGHKSHPICIGHSSTNQSIPPSWRIHTRVVCSR